MTYYRRARLLKTGQTTPYFIKDDGGQQKGITKIYTVFETAGSATVDSPHYAAATIAFAATTPGTITDSANLLATVLTGDKIRIRGSALNDNGGVEYNVSTGSVAGTIRTTEATVAENAGAYITILKRATHSNNTVLDNNTGLMWARYIQTGKVGAASDGKLNWYDATKCYTLHVANNDVSIIAPNILRIVGSDKSVRYFPGAVLVCSGFAQAVNNLPGLTVVSVSYAGGNTDIIVDPGNQTLIAEASQNVTIKIVCQNIFAYAAAANVAGLGAYRDWRNPNMTELQSLLDYELQPVSPDTTAFPSFLTGGANRIWSSNTNKGDPTFAFTLYCATDYTSDLGPNIAKAKTVMYRIALIRGGQ